MRGKNKTTTNLDPLYQLFEQYLLTRSYDDAAAFTKQLAQDYLAYLDSTPAHVPMNVRESVLEDLESEAHELLVKKMYGCVRWKDYENYGRVVTLDDDFANPEEYERFNLAAEGEEDLSPSNDDETA